LTEITAARRHEERQNHFAALHRCGRPIRPQLREPGVVFDLSYRLYGLGKPDLQLAATSFKADVHLQRLLGARPDQAAMVGQTAVAKEYLIYNFTNKERRTLKFPAFWAKRNDLRAPTKTTAATAEHALQQMLMQTE